MPIALIATVALAEHGLKVRAGERFDTSPIVAAALTRQRKARFATADEAAPRRRAYRRRDMTAQTDPA